MCTGAVGRPTTDHWCHIRMHANSGTTVLALPGLGPRSSMHAMYGVMHVGRPLPKVWAHGMLAETLCYLQRDDHDIPTLNSHHNRPEAYGKYCIQSCFFLHATIYVSPHVALRESHTYDRLWQTDSKLKNQSHAYPNLCNSDMSLVS